MDREMEMNGNHPNQRMRGRRGRGSGSGWRGYLLMKRGYFSHFTPHGCFGKLCAKEVSSTIYFFLDGWRRRKVKESLLVWSWVAFRGPLGMHCKMLVCKCKGCFQ